MVLQEHYTLSNGVMIPKIGLGTWLIADKDVTQVVKDAVRIGYRHIDTAQAYRNERGVGEGIRSCKVSRNELFVTTKLAAEIKSYKKAVSAIDGSLKKLGLDYIDMMIIHSPKPWMKFKGSERFFEGNREAWRALEDAYTAGKLRAIGLSNFEKEDIDNILSSCRIKPMVNQILAHISNFPRELVQYTQEQGLLVEAYSPIGHGELFKNESIVKMAETYQVSVPQLAIRFALQLGLLPLPKTADPIHLETNINVDFSIADDDMEYLVNIDTIKDYGDASMMPVYGGKLNLKSIVSVLFPKRRK
ncbi:MAG: aldo/keto reductase [Sphaerochaetaceae bacterium]